MLSGDIGVTLCQETQFDGLCARHVVRFRLAPPLTLSRKPTPKRLPERVGNFGGLANASSRLALSEAAEFSTIRSDSSILWTSRKDFPKLTP